MHVGIVIANFNESECLSLCLESIIRAKTSIRFSVGIIDDCTATKNAESADALFAAYHKQKQSTSDFFIQSRDYLGFQSSCNAAIQRFLTDPSITHICVLHVDVLVTDEWLEILLHGDPDVIGPVTNCAQNEQAVSIDYAAEKQRESIFLANKHARMRFAAYGTYQTKTTALSCFLTIFSRRVIDSAGLFDDTSDSILTQDRIDWARIRNAGYRVLIARGCFVHHFGSDTPASQDTLQQEEAVSKDRPMPGESGCSGILNSAAMQLQSCRQDLLYCSNQSTNPWTLERINDSIAQTQTQINRCVAASAFDPSLQKENVRTNKQSGGAPQAKDTRQFFTEDSISGSRLLKLVARKAFRKASKLLPVDQLRSSMMPSKKQSALRTAKFEQVMEAIRESRQGRGCVCIFAPIFDISNDKDGYIQRVKAIDETVFHGYLRIYLYDDGSQLDDWNVIRVDAEHLYIRLNSHNPTNRNLLFQLTREAGLIYTHSLLRFMTDRIHEGMLQVFAQEGVKRIWDVHGAVPEEYLLNGKRASCSVANDVEAFLYTHVDVILTVTESMTRHLRQKHGATHAQIIVLPIFSPGSLSIKSGSTDHKAFTPPLIVYAGGLQSWQNIALMQDVMEQTMQTLRYRILVPNPKLFVKSWGKRAAMQQISVLSRPPEEMEEEYKIAQYGFVLRDDIAVNHVACPTKIMEYLQHGVIPILKSPTIGDFCALGMQYVSYEQLIQGKLPSEAERQKMVEENFRILDRLLRVHLNGMSEIAHFLSTLR